MHQKMRNQRWWKPLEYTKTLKQAPTSVNNLVHEFSVLNHCAITQKSHSLEFWCNYDKMEGFQAKNRYPKFGRFWTIFQPTIDINNFEQFFFNPSYLANYSTDLNEIWTAVSLLAVVYETAYFVKIIVYSIVTIGNNMLQNYVLEHEKIFKKISSILDIISNISWKFESVVIFCLKDMIIQSWCRSAFWSEKLKHNRML